MLEGQFRQYLENERNYSPHTILAYTADLEAFSRFLQAHYDLALYDLKGAGAVSHRMIRVWMGELMDGGLGNRSVARKLASIGAFFRYLRKKGMLQQNPVTKVKAPKAEKKLPTFVQRDGIEALFGEVAFEEGMEGTRDRAILEVLYSCGLRRSELVGLQFYNIDFHNLSLKVMGKGRKERIVPLGRPAAAAMRAYMRACDELGLDYRQQFFLKADGEPVYDRLVHRVVDRYLRQVGSLSKTSPHVLRHTFATHLLDSGADLNAIKEMLGHASLAATQVYVHNSISKLKDVYSKAHPKA